MYVYQFHHNTPSDVHLSSVINKFFPQNLHDMGVNDELNHGRCTVVYSPVQIHPHLEEAEGHSYN